MLSLNKVYENDELYYWCNACSDINIPGADPSYCGDIDELPIKQRNLYENYWNESAGCCMYVVDYKGNPAMALGYLFDASYLSDLLKKNDVSDEDMEVFYNAVYDCGTMLERTKEVSDCEVLVGKDTDPDGHELLIIVPYARRNKIEEIAKYLDGVVYSTVETLL